VSDLYGRAGRAWLHSVPLSPMARVQVDLLLEMVDVLDQRVVRPLTTALSEERLNLSLRPPPSIACTAIQ